MRNFPRRSGAIALASLLVMGAQTAAAQNVARATDLDFGRFAASSVQPARVTVTPEGTRTTDHATLLGGTGPQAARFTVDGEGGRAFQASIIRGFSGQPGVSLENVTASCGFGSAFNAASGTLSGCRLSVAGAAEILVGATLAVDAGEGSTSLSLPNAITVQVTY